MCLAPRDGYGRVMDDSQTGQESSDGNAEQGSGERPESPEEATTPPGNPDVDEEKVEETKEEADATKPY